MNNTFDGRNNHIDFMRLMLALLVIYSHSFSLALGNELTEPFALLSKGQVTGGHVAVDSFFILSGFLITASFERSSSVRSYLKKRIARVYPGYIFLTFISLLVALPLSHATVAGSDTLHKLLNIAGNTLRLQEFHYTGAFPANPYPGEINGSLWSISYEAWCYVGVLILGILGWLRSRRLLLGLFAASIVISLLFAHFLWTPGGRYLGLIFGYPPFWARLLPMYLSGVVFYRFRAHLPISTGRIALSLVAGVAACLLPLGYTLLFPIFGAYLFLTLCYSHSLPFPHISRFGDYSYGTYLYAFPVQQLIMLKIGHTCSPYSLFAIAAPITVALAAASWFLVESPALRISHWKKTGGPSGQ